MVWIVLNNAIALWGNDVIMYLGSVFLVLRELMEHGALKIANAQKMAPPFAYIPRVNVFVPPIIMAIGIIGWVFKTRHTRQARHTRQHKILLCAVAF